MKWRTNVHRHVEETVCWIVTIPKFIYNRFNHFNQRNMFHRHRHQSKQKKNLGDGAIGYNKTNQQCLGSLQEKSHELVSKKIKVWRKEKFALKGLKINFPLKNQKVQLLTTRHFWWLLNRLLWKNPCRRQRLGLFWEMENGKRHSCSYWQIHCWSAKFSVKN